VSRPVLGLRSRSGHYGHTSDPGGLVVITQLQPISLSSRCLEDNVPRDEPVDATHALAVTRTTSRLTTKLAERQLRTVRQPIDTTPAWCAWRRFATADNRLFPNQF